MLHAAVALLVGDTWSAIWTAFAFAFNPTVWLYSTQVSIFLQRKRPTCLACAVTLRAGAS